MQQRVIILNDRVPNLFFVREKIHKTCLSSRLFEWKKTHQKQLFWSFLSHIYRREVNSQCNHDFNYQKTSELQYFRLPNWWLPCRAPKVPVLLLLLRYRIRKTFLCWPFKIMNKTCVFKLPFKAIHPIDLCSREGNRSIRRLFWELYSFRSLEYEEYLVRLWFCLHRVGNEGLSLVTWGHGTCSRATAGNRPSLAQRLPAVSTPQASVHYK